MAARKMTFSLPEELALRLIRRVASRDRSRFLAEALEKSLRQEDADLIRSCQMANQDADAASIEAEWDQINDPIKETWSNRGVAPTVDAKARPRAARKR